MTHLSVPDERKQALGITDNLVRISIGVEDADDLIADFEAGARDRLMRAAPATPPDLPSRISEWEAGWGSRPAPLSAKADRNI